MTKTVSLRLKPHQIEEIKIAALAAHLPVATYLYRRVTDTPILLTPSLAALAELVRLACTLESDPRTEPQLLNKIRELVELLSATPSHQDDLG